MNQFLRELVRDRAGNRCEYCRLPQWCVAATFHVEHIVARQHGGADEADNLALACDRCNFLKGTNLTAIDPMTRAVVRLFNPRTQQWREHFTQAEFQLVGLTDCGRATVQLLSMNSEPRVKLRRTRHIQIESP
jgi:hypothetical protein